MITYKQTHSFLEESLRLAVKNNGNAIATNGKNVLRTTIIVDSKRVRVDFVNWHVIDGVTLTRTFVVDNYDLALANNLFEGLRINSWFKTAVERFYKHYAKKESNSPKLKGEW